MTSRTIILILMAALAVMSCKDRSSGETEGTLQTEESATGKAEQIKVLPFPEASVPSMLGSEYEKTVFLAEHYWEKFTDPSRNCSSDSLHVSGVLRSDVEQHFANYAQLLSMLPESEAEQAVRVLWPRLLAAEAIDPSSDVLETLVGLAEKYFYDVNSPLRNEDLYGILATYLSECELVDEALRGKYAFDAQMCALNKVGTRANDFRFRDIGGRDRRLWQLQEEYVLLFFSNPGCHACKAIIDQLKSSPRIGELMSGKRLAVVNMYIDEDLDAWESYMPIYPEEWYNVYDPDYVIRTDLTYNVRAIPSLYLLDADKTVLLKDAAPEKVFWYLENQI